ncbi:unnamed protein product, partial [Rotaria magnacalcarata]
NKKRKRPSNKEKVRKQPVKKRARKTSKNTAGQRRSRASGVTSTSRWVKPKQTKSARKKADNNDETVKPKKKTTKIPKVPKTQMFKVHSNRSLKENTIVTNYQEEPFFEDNLPVPFISSFVQSKLAIRAVLINDSKLLKSLINDVDHVCSIHVNRSLYNDLSAMHYAIKNNNVNMVKILLDDIKTPKKKRCPFPTVSVIRQSTG